MELTAWYTEVAEARVYRGALPMAKSLQKGESFNRQQGKD